MNPGANRGHLAGGFPPLRKICSGLANKHEDEAGGDQDFGYGGWRLAAGCWRHMLAVDDSEWVSGNPWKCLPGCRLRCQDAVCCLRIRCQLPAVRSAATDSALFNRIWVDNRVMVPLPFCCASNRSANALFCPNLWQKSKFALLWKICCNFHWLSASRIRVGVCAVGHMHTCHSGC